MFSAEEKGLNWLRGTHGLKIPEVLFASTPEEPPFLVLEWLEPAPRVSNFDEMLGQGLAQLHRTLPHGFGLEHSNYIGSLKQFNRA
jgi:hypothetical protein